METLQDLIRMVSRLGVRARRSRSRRKRASRGSKFMTQPAEKVELKPETLLAFTTHIAAAEADIKARLRGEGQFPDGSAERVTQLRKGTVIVELCSGKRPLQVPDGLIHDWIGVIYIPAQRLKRPWHSCRITIITRISTSPK